MPKPIQCPECGGEVLSLKVMYLCAKDHVWGDIVDRPVTITDVHRSTEPELDAKVHPGVSLTVGGKKVGSVDPTSTPAKMTMPFGKHRGKQLADIPIDYFEWCLTNIDNLREDLAAEMQNQIDLKKGKGVAR